MDITINNLSAYIKAKQNKCLLLDYHRSIARQVLLGLNYLFGKTVTNRDLKPSNILVIKWNQIINTLKIKLANFSLSSKESELCTLYGTKGYLALEIKYGKTGKDRKHVYMYIMAVNIWAIDKLLCKSLNKRDEHLDNEGRKSQTTAPALYLITQTMQLNSNACPTMAQYF